MFTEGGAVWDDADDSGSDSDEYLSIHAARRRGEAPPVLRGSRGGGRRGSSAWDVGDESDDSRDAAENARLLLSIDDCKGSVEAGGVLKKKRGSSAALVDPSPPTPPAAAGRAKKRVRISSAHGPASSDASPPDADSEARKRISLSKFFEDIVGGVQESPPSSGDEAGSATPPHISPSASRAAAAVAAANAAYNSRELTDDEDEDDDTPPKAGGGGGFLTRLLSSKARVPNDSDDDDDLSDIGGLFGAVDEAPTTATPPASAAAPACGSTEAGGAAAASASPASAARPQLQRVEKVQEEEEEEDVAALIARAELEDQQGRAPATSPVAGISACSGGFAWETSRGVAGCGGSGGGGGGGGGVELGADGVFCFSEANKKAEMAELQRAKQAASAAAAAAASASPVQEEAAAAAATAAPAAPSHPQKEKGNADLKKGRHADAVAAYTEALDAVLSEDDPESLDNFGEKQLRGGPARLYCDEAHVLYSNRSSAHLAMGHVKKAFADAVSCIVRRPSWFKGYMRKALVYRAIGEADSALAALDAAVAACVSAGDKANEKSLRAQRTTTFSAASCAAEKAKVKGGQEQFHATFLKEADLGAKAFQRKDWAAAVKHYSAAVQVDRSAYVVLSNRAAALMHLGQSQRSLSDGHACVSLNPAYGKAYVRKATALKSLALYSEALDALKKGIAAVSAAGGDIAQLTTLQAEVQKLADTPSSSGVRIG